jgi:AcrR family transcriptional regulator
MPAARRTKQQVVSEFRHAEILAAARRVFAARGYEGASVEEIARTAGVAKGTVYLYYRSKDEIYQAALREGLLALCAELRLRVQAARGVQDTIRAFVDTKLAHFEEHRDFLRIYVAAFGNLTPQPAAQRECRALYLEQLSLLEAGMRAALRHDRVRHVPAEAAALAVFDLTKGVVQRRLLGRSREATEKDVAFLLELLRKGLAQPALRPVREQRRSV